MTSVLQYLKNTNQTITRAKPLHMYYVRSYTCTKFYANDSP